MFDTLKKLEISTGLFQIQHPGVNLWIISLSHALAQNGGITQNPSFCIIQWNKHIGRAKGH